MLIFVLGLFWPLGDVSEMRVPILKNGSNGLASCMKSRIPLSYTHIHFDYLSRIEDGLATRIKQNSRRVVFLNFHLRLS